MNKRKHRILSRPILSAILLILYTQIVAGICSLIFKGNMIYIAMPILSFGFLFVHKLWFMHEYKGSFCLNFLKDKKLLSYILVFLVIDLLDILLDGFRLGFTAPTLLSLGMALTAGILEETVFRALPVSTMMRTLKDKGRYWLALVLPALLFGLIHYTNMSEGQSFLNTTAQVISAGCAGFMFGAIYLRTGSILPSMIIHFLHDLGTFMIASNSTGIATSTFSTFDLIELVVFSGIQLILTFFILKGQKQHIIHVWKERWNA